VAQQRVVAGERGLVGLAAEAGVVAGYDRDRCRDDVDDLTGGLVDQLQLAAIGPQVVEAEDAFSSATAPCRQARASLPRPVGVMVMARQYYTVQPESPARKSDAHQP
jgi:hypothetical protein